MTEYRHIVDVAKAGLIGNRYDGTNPDEAMAAWSKAISDGEEYVTLESLRTSNVPADAR